MQFNSCPGIVPEAVDLCAVHIITFAVSSSNDEVLKTTFWIGSITNYHLVSRVYEAAAGMITSPLRQLCQVPLPASLIVHGDSSFRVVSPRDDDHFLVLVGDGAGRTVRDKV